MPNPDVAAALAGVDAARKASGGAAPTPLPKSKKSTTTPSTGSTSTPATGTKTPPKPKKPTRPSVKRVSALTIADPKVERPNGMTYHSRLVGDHSDVAMLRTARERNIPVLLDGPPGTGKLLPLDTPIPTPDGWTTMGDIQPGDVVLGRDGLPTNVTFVSEVEDTPVLYDITFSDGSVVTACADHQWTVTTRDQRLATRTKQQRRYRREAIEKRQMLIQELAASDDLPKRMTASELLEFVGSIDNLPWSHSKSLLNFLMRSEVPNVVEVHEITYQVNRTKAVRSSDTPVTMFDSVPALEAMASSNRHAFTWVGSDPLPECVLTTQQMVDQGVVKESASETRSNFSVRMHEPLELPHRDLTIDPYVFGVWLGDGHVEFNLAASITSEDPQIVNEVIKAGYDLYGITVDDRSNAFEFSFSGLGRDLTTAGITHKRIPTEYLRASKEQRLALLQGLMDTDGSISRNGTCELALSDPILAADAEELIHSLGIKVSRKIGDSGYRNSDGDYVACEDRHRMVFTTTTPVFRLERKARHTPKAVRPTQNFLYVTDITPAPTRPGKCIQVDNADRMYLCERSMIPTHNTALCEASWPDLVTFSCTGDTEVRDLVGTWVPNEDGDGYEWVPGPVQIAAEEGRPLLLDDATLASPQVLAVIYPLMDGRGEIRVAENPKLGVIKAKEGFYVIAAHNPGVHGAILTEALASRFILRVNVSTDYELARTLGVNSGVVSVAENLSAKVTAGEINWAPQLRELLGYKNVADALGDDIALANLLGQCPEEDRPVAASVIRDRMGRTVKVLSLGEQITV